MAKERPLDIKDQEYIARLRKSGTTFREIAKLMKVSLGAVQNAVKKLKVNPKAVTKLQIKKKADIVEKTIKIIEEFTPSDKTSAIEVHRKVMGMVDKKPAVALAAAEKTLDRIEGKPIQRNINENVNVEISSDKISKLLNDKGYMRVLDNL